MKVASHSLNIDRDIDIEAIVEIASTLKFGPRDFENEKQIVMEVVKRQGRTPKDASDEHKK